MSRTYRYDPEAGCGRGGKSEARRRDAERAASEAEPMPAAEGAFHGEGAFPDGSARAGEAEMAEAVKMMRPRVEHLVWAMERDGVICRSTPNCTGMMSRPPMRMLPVCPPSRV